MVSLQPCFISAIAPFYFSNSTSYFEKFPIASRERRHAKDPLAPLLDSLQPVRPGHASPRSRGLQPASAHSRLPRSSRLELDVGGTGRRFCGAGLLLAWPPCGPGVRDLLRHRTLAQCRQSFRFPGDLSVFPRACRAAAQGAFLGNSRRARHAGNFYPGRSRADPSLPLDHLRVWRFAGLQRHSVVSRGRGGDSSREESHLATVSPLDAGDQRLREWQIFRTYSGTLRHTAAGCVAGGGDHRCAVCRGLHSGGPGHYAECIYRLYLERIRHSRTTIHVLCPCRNDGNVRLLALWFVARADFCRSKDAGFALLPHSYGTGVGRSSGRAGHLSGGVAAVPTKGLAIFNFQLPILNSRLL